MAYSEAQKRASAKYVKETQKSLLIKFKKEQYENEILPAALNANVPVGTYIKKAVFEKITRDKESIDKNTTRDNKQLN